MSQLEVRRKATWNAMEEALVRGDIDAAVSFFSEPRQDRYRAVFTALSGQIAQIAQDMQDIELMAAVDGIAQFRIRRLQFYGGQWRTFTYYIRFIQDGSGVWNIDSF